VEYYGKRTGSGLLIRDDLSRLGLKNDIHNTHPPTTTDRNTAVVENIDTGVRSERVEPSRGCVDMRSAPR
jgi:hypothetical protein